ncbi:unnamed protein product [Phytomonas sp. Hart1]|nr:unnamed protein product [Phytomonas sp. Hart1]|eukprot:CCW67037.1 unnamed protein product [Phytomonas sp. isolate Hart1]
MDGSSKDRCLLNENDEIAPSEMIFDDYDFDKIRAVNLQPQAGCHDPTLRVVILSSEDKQKVLTKPWKRILSTLLMIEPIKKQWKKVSLGCPSGWKRPFLTPKAPGSILP